MKDKIKYIKMVIPIRYEEEDIPNCFPLRDGKSMSLTYDVKTGELQNLPHNYDELLENSFQQIVNWNTKEKRVDKTLLGQYIFQIEDIKVVDSGSYYLLDENFNTLSSREKEYVPDSYSIRGEYGDYIHLTIDLKNRKLLDIFENPTFDEFEL